MVASSAHGGYQGGCHAATAEDDSVHDMFENGLHPFPVLTLLVLLVYSFDAKAAADGRSGQE